MNTRTLYSCRRTRTERHTVDGPQGLERSGIHQLEKPSSAEVCWRQDIVGDGNAKDPLAEEPLAEGRVLGQGRPIFRSA